MKKKNIKYHSDEWKNELKFWGNFTNIIGNGEDINEEYLDKVYKDIEQLKNDLIFIYGLQTILKEGELVLEKLES